MVSIKDEISKIEKEIIEKQSQLKSLNKLLGLYPDLESYTGRWSKKVYCSKSVNNLVTNYDSRHNCGCCADSPLEVWPYLETEFGRIYSSPAMYFIGNGREFGYGDEPKPGWKKKLRENGIPESLIEKMSHHFDEEDEEDDED